MCKPSRPKVPDMPAPPPPTTSVTIDEEVSRERNRERRRAAGRYGRQSTMMAGGAGSPTGQSKTLLGG